MLIFYLLEVLGHISMCIFITFFLDSLFILRAVLGYFCWYFDLCVW